MLCLGKGIPSSETSDPSGPHRTSQTPTASASDPVGLVIYYACKVHSDVSTTHVYSCVCPDSKAHAHEQVYSPPCDMVPASSLNTLMCCSTSFTRAHLLSILTLSELPSHLQTPARAAPAASENFLPSRPSSEGTLSE